VTLAVAFNVLAVMDVDVSEVIVPVADTLSERLVRSTKDPVAPVKPPWEYMGPRKKELAVSTVKSSSCTSMKLVLIWLAPTVGAFNEPCRSVKPPSRLVFTRLPT
jgi:hypothetical protein